MGETDSGGALVDRPDWSETPPSVAVVDAIASLEDVDPIELSTALDTTLYDHVDPEALDAVVAGDVEVTFAVDDYRVEIRGDELSVSVEDG